MATRVVVDKTRAAVDKVWQGAVSVKEARRKQHDGRGWRECTDGEADALASCSWEAGDATIIYQSINRNRAASSERKGGARVAGSS